ncbi:hypothetical protein CN918_25905 [Priestia megaterium]|nr:hypothetical protein CN918_25905 [Priestia megaterium]
MKKKWLISILVAVMVLVLAACSEKEVEKTEKQEKEVQKKDEKVEKLEKRENKEEKADTGGKLLKEETKNAPNKELSQKNQGAKGEVKTNKGAAVKPNAHAKDIEVAKKYAQTKGLVKGLKVQYEFSHTEKGYNIIRVFEQLDNRQHVVAWLAVNAKTKKVYDTTVHPLSVVLEKEVNNYEGIDYTGYGTEDEALYKDRLIAQKYAESKGLVKGIKVNYEFTQSEGNFSIIRVFEQKENREVVVAWLAVNKTTKKVYDVTTKPLSRQIK